VVGPTQKRKAVAALVNRGRSLSAACRRIGLARSTWNYERQIPQDEEAAVQHIKDLSQRFPRFGYRRIVVMLKREGRPMNRKRVQRLWQLAGFDRTIDGKSIKVLSVIDEYTRECVALPCARSMSAHDVARVLDRAAKERGAPAFVRSDNGPEFISIALQEWTATCDAQMRYVKPGSPWQNGCVESFHDKMRDEFLQMETFSTVAEARVMLEDWRLRYNQIRPHSSLEYLTPSEFAATLCGADVAPLHPPRRGTNPSRLSPC